MGVSPTDLLVDQNGGFWGIDIARSTDINGRKGIALIIRDALTLPNE